jgi:hypothetical protein
MAFPPDINLLIPPTATRWLHARASGMAVQEIGIPSGFEADVNSLEDLSELKKIETEDRKLILYFDQVCGPIIGRVGRGGSVVTRQPRDRKVVGSNPSPGAIMLRP